MKNSVFVLLASLFMFQLNAQLTIKPGIGLNVTDYSKDPWTGEAKAKTGWQIGGTVAFGKRLYFETGLFYVGKSTEVTDFTMQPNSIEAKLNGIRLPIGAGLGILGNAKTMLHIRAMGGLSGFVITSVSDDINEEGLNKTSWGVYAGAGVDFWKFYIDLSYEWSVTNINKDVSQVDLGKTRSLFLTGGLRIKF
ncbi:MAG TPA: outer membrane beta-barrel protein [Chitinophagaceae bacterium]